MFKDELLVTRWLARELGALHLNIFGKCLSYVKVFTRTLVLL